MYVVIKVSGIQENRPKTRQPVPEDTGTEGICPKGVQAGNTHVCMSQHSVLSLIHSLHVELINTFARDTANSPFKNKDFLDD